MALCDTSLLSPDRLFSSEPVQREVARELYDSIVELPLVCPHGHVDPRLFADPEFSFGSPTELLLIPDHYIFRMLYSQGIGLESLGIPAIDGSSAETDHLQIWRRFAEHFYLFRGTPTGIWLTDELNSVFGVDQKLCAETAEAIYEQVNAQLQSPEFNARQLFEQFNIEVLCTTDAATDTLQYHQRIQQSGWSGRILPTFRPDAVVNIDRGDWPKHIDALSAASGMDVVDYATYIRALEDRRSFFKSMGAHATDHAVQSAYTTRLSPAQADAIFQRALRRKATTEDSAQFTAQMLMEMARMSAEDGLVMQLHVGSYRNHNQALFDRFGADMGADIPIFVEFTRNLRPLLNEFGDDPRLTLIVYSLDETAYSRELAPLAGHYQAVKLGPPWWFHDSLNGILRFFHQVMETAGLYNSVGFNDDTRAFPSIPARHDVWRRASADWVAGLVVRGIVDDQDAVEMVRALAYELAKQAYKL